LSDFLTNFRSYFSEEDRKSEIYRIFATIGVNTERTILEELNAEIRRSTEAIMFSEDKLRSGLAFFLTPVRNVISASGFGRVAVNSIEGSHLTFATMPAGSIVIGSNGKEYQIQNDLTLNLGCSTPFTFVQGVESTYTTKYSEFIAIPIESGFVDLSYTKVSLSMGSTVMDIPVVATFPEYPIDLTEVFPVLSSVVKNFYGGVVEDVDLWNPLLKNVDALWGAVKGVSVRPRSGFFPFFFNNTLFIKIYSGGRPGDIDYVPDPSEQSITVSYRISDGAYGNLGQNQLESFAEAIITDDDGLVKVTLYNEEALNGVNPPSHAELVNKYRQRFFASTHVSSVPEYTVWFLAQPSVGDCLVVSDFKRWVLSGNETLADFNITGAVEIYLVDVSGNPVIPRSSISSGYSPLIKELNDKLEAVMDVAFLKYEEPLTYWHYFVVQFRSVYSEVEFIANATAALSDLYSILWVRSNGTSLFRDLDIDIVTNAVRGDSNVSGLRVTPYHYYEHSHDIFTDDDNSFALFRHYYGEKSGGWYEYWEKNSNGDFGHFLRDGNDNLTFDGDNNITSEFIKDVPCSLYKEYEDLNGNCNIYRYIRRLDHNTDGTLAGWGWSGLWPDGSTVYAGVRANGGISFKMKNLAPGVLRCFWGIANEGLIPVGNDIATGFGIRKLPSGQSVLAGETKFGETSRFEKSN